MIISKKNNVRAIIIDDEVLARKNLSILLKDFCNGIDILGEAGNVQEGLTLIASTNPELIFLDIRMPSGNEGFDLLEKISGTTLYPFRVVFITAFKEYALKAFRANAVDYILKPIEISELQQCITKIKEDILTQKSAELYTQQVNNFTTAIQRNDIQRITVSHSKGIKIIETKEIIRLEAQNNYTSIVFNHGKSLLDTRTLKTYHNFLPTNRFQRIHNSHIINIKHLMEYKNESGPCAIMSNRDSVPISRSHLTDFINLVKNIH